MRKTRGGRGAALLALALAAGCGDRAKGEEEAPPPPPASSAPTEGVQVEMVLPDSMAWGREGELRLRVANRGRTPIAASTLELRLAPGVVPLDSTGMAPAGAAPPGGARVDIAVPALAAGQAADFVQRVRAPAPPAPGDSAARARVLLLRARVVSAGGAVTGAERLDTLLLRTPPALVCAGKGDVSVTRYGVGAVRLGMAAEDLRSLCPDARDTAWTAEGMREQGVVVPVGQRRLVALLSRGKVERVVVPDSGLATAAGMGVGATLGELRARYGPACAGMAERAVAVWFPNAPGISFGVGAPPPPGWTRAGGDPAALPDSARVTRMWVRAGRDDCPAPRPATTGEGR